MAFGKMIAVQFVRKHATEDSLNLLTCQDVYFGILLYLRMSEMRLSVRSARALNGVVFSAQMLFNCLNF